MRRRPKIPVSPGIVFVNCCFLGVGQTDLEGRPPFAANIAIELIKLGARCVIAAGWAIDDNSASIFAQRFYKGILNGETFGDATLNARRDAYREARKNGGADATWGAYQCYGDPDYRLRVLPDSKSSGEKFSFVAASEAVEAVRQIRDELNIGVERKIDELKSRLEKIETAAENWLHCAELRVALAEAWGELADFPVAIAHYEAAVSSSDASYTVKAAEQLANLRARNAVACHRSTAPGERDAEKVNEIIRAVLASIEELTRMLGETSERLVLQGGCWKQLAQIQYADGGEDNALETMAALYDRAAELAQDEDKSYPQLMASCARICVAIRDGRDCDARVAERLKALIDKPPEEDDDFWRLVLVADAGLIDAIASAKNLDAQLADLVVPYRRAWRHVARR